MEIQRLFRDANVRLARGAPGEPDLPQRREPLDVIRENGVPPATIVHSLAALRSYFAAGGGVTSVVIFRIMPSDLLKT